MNIALEKAYYMTIYIYKKYVNLLLST